MKIAMIGAGSWGTAMISQLALRHENIILYSREEKVIEDIRTAGANLDYLPEVQIPKHVRLTSDLEEAVQGAEALILATPSHAIANTAESIRPFLRDNALVISAAKGLSADGRRLSLVLDEVFADKTSRIAVLSGPNHAEEVGLGQPAATVIASKVPEAAMRAQEIYMLPHLRAYYSTDVIGVEYGGVLKNIIALAAGVVEGLAYGDNTTAALITRGLTEITRFATHFGAHTQTLFGLSGMGDLIVTCTSRHSRNRSAGIQLAQGRTKTEIQGGTAMIIEGIRTTELVYPIAREHGIEMPITEQVYGVLQETIQPADALKNLLAREKKEELQEPVF